MLALSMDTTDLERGIKLLAEMPNLIRNTVVGALSDTVDDVHTLQTSEMKAAFDRPTNFMLKGLRKLYPGGMAGKQSRGARFGMGVLEAGTEFEFFPVGRSPEDIVRPHVFGGGRRLKASERQLAGVGALPAGGFSIMGRNYPRDTHGNISGARYSQMIHALGGMSDTTRSSLPKSRQKNRAGVSFFVLPVRGTKTPLAIAERRGKTATIMLVASRPPQYQKRYSFFETGKRQAEYSLPLHFNRIVQRYASRL